MRTGPRGRPAAAATAALAWAASAGTAWGCPVCYGAAEGGIVDGARLGIWLLLGVTVLVQAAFVTFFVTLWRRARRSGREAIDAEWRDLQSRSLPTP